MSTYHIKQASRAGPAVTPRLRLLRFDALRGNRVSGRAYVHCCVNAMSTLAAPVCCNLGTPVVRIRIRSQGVAVLKKELSHGVVYNDS